MRDGFIKVAAGTPKIRVADCRYNAEQIFTMMREADKQGVKVLCLPELCLTGYTCGDLFLQDTLLCGAEEGLQTILEATRNLDMVTVLGLPVRCKWDNKLYNCAAVIQSGEILGLVPKTYLPNYGEFYEQRWFASGAGVETSVDLCGETVDMDAAGLFACETVPNLVLGVEICEDLWATEPPSARLARGGATVILNLSASNELVGKSGYRRNLVVGQSGRLVCGYVYADAGEGESTTDLVFTGHNMIAENGALLAERRFATGLTISEIDVDRLAYERRRMTTFNGQRQADLWRASFSLPLEETRLTRAVSPAPFVPADAEDRAERCNEILKIAALGLKKRLEHTGARTAVVGLSGGLDSTLALLIAVRAYDALGLDRGGIHAVTMPGMGTGARTKSNADRLMEALRLSASEISIEKAVRQHFADIGQDESTHDVTYENSQARERTQILMDFANRMNGIVLGTGDMSEMALGFCTYNGDHMSMYNVNCSVPKTLVKSLVRYLGERCFGGAVGDICRDIIDTPISPELLPVQDGELAQRTEDILGDYALHDFFLYHLLDSGSGPERLRMLAAQAFSGVYEERRIREQLKTFLRRFFTQQFKRNCVPDGPKVGSIGLSPRGDLRMPSDMSCRMWMEAEK